LFIGPRLLVISVLAFYIFADLRLPKMNYPAASCWVSDYSATPECLIGRSSGLGLIQNTLYR
jgi:hypothetical protein